MAYTLRGVVSEICQNVVDGGLGGRTLIYVVDGITVGFTESLT